MNARYYSPDPLTSQHAMLARCRIQDLERDIEQIQLAKLARATRRHRDAPLAALLQWLHARLAARPRRQVGSIQPSPR